jgi:hypothetical protein
MFGRKVSYKPKYSKIVVFFSMAAQFTKVLSNQSILEYSEYCDILG